VCFAESGHAMESSEILSVQSNGSSLALVNEAQKRFNGTESSVSKYKFDKVAICISRLFIYLFD
jgi:hypothetical protein